MPVYEVAECPFRQLPPAIRIYERGARFASCPRSGTVPKDRHVVEDEIGAEVQFENSLCRTKIAIFAAENWHHMTDAHR
jgi:hypothetical protein